MLSQYQKQVFTTKFKESENFTSSSRFFIGLWRSCPSRPPAVWPLMCRSSSSFDVSSYLSCTVSPIKRDLRTVRLRSVQSCVHVHSFVIHTVACLFGCVLEISAELDGHPQARVVEHVCCAYAASSRVERWKEANGSAFGCG